MQKTLRKEAEQYAKQNRRKRIWHKIVQVMACVVVFCTTYALILPAITMEQMPCDLEEHTHSESCYAKVEPESAAVLACSYESLGVHVHTSDCYSSENQVICGQADYLIHTHTDVCLDGNGEVVCRIPEASAHIHTDACYTTVESVPEETESPHSHGDECYAVQRGELICQLAETEGHSHEPLCYVQGELLCQRTEEPGHTHGEGCSETVLVCELTVEPHVHGDGCYRQLVCDIPEGENHTHTEECSGATLCCNLTEQPHVHTNTCYQTNALCDLPETEGHTHGAECYEALLSCGLAEEAAHHHGDECYELLSVLICELEEGVISDASAETHEGTEPERKLICTEPAAQVHVHSEACFVEAPAEEDPLTCTLPEDENHTHGAQCYGTWELICGKEEHTHNLVCMNDPEADLETEADWKATFADVVLTGEWDQDLLAIARSQLGYEESTRNYLVLEDGETIRGYTRYGAWYRSPYGDWCAMFVSFCLNYAEIPQDAIPYEAKCTKWISALQEPEYDLYRPAEEYTPVPGDLIFFDWEADGESDHVGIVTELVPNKEEEPPMVRTIEGNNGNRVSEWAYPLDDSVIMGYGKLPEKLPVYCCGLQEHGHDASCLDENGDLICELEEHIHSQNCGILTTEEWTRVQQVIALIDEMPSYGEIDARAAEYQSQGDEDGEVAYLEQVYAQVQQVYGAYSALGEALQTYVTNADKLLELEYIWSAATLDTGTPSTIYQINTYSSGSTTQTSGTVMYVGRPVGNSGNQEFVWWKEVVVEWQDGYMRVAKISPADGTTSKMGDEASPTGFILLFHSGITDGFPYNVAVGDYVIPDFFIHQTGTDIYEFNSNGYGNVSFSKTPPDYSITSAPTTVLQYQDNGGRVAHTADFVDMNVYNYNYSVNDTWRNNQYYPGFQWPGGAYVDYNSNYQNWETTTSSLNIGIPDFRVHRQYVDSLSFGDSIVHNMQYAGSKSAYDSNANGKYGKAPDATNVARLYDRDDANETGRINWLWYSGSHSDDSYSNRPVGWTLKTTGTEGKAIQFKMNDNTPVTVNGISLKYLFPYDLAAGDTNVNGVTKMNSQSVDGLFQVNPVSGLYYYNSHNNHAQYSENRFTLYDQIITPDFLLYPFGNFLPFNNINTEATQVGAFNYSGGMKTYVDGTVYKLQKWMADGRKQENYPADPFENVYGYSSRYQLGIMLSEYEESWHNVDSGATWNGLTSGAALADFFGGASHPNGAAPVFTQAQLNNMYNIDWDESTDFFFGMDMSMNFLMPKNALAGCDNGNNNEPWEVLPDGTFVRGGSPDGIPDYPMVFNFAGDDDVWVYIDGLLFLDLTGIHRHVGGTIDFETGMVYYFGLDTSIGDTSNNTANANYYYAETFEEIIKRSFTTSEAEQMNAMLKGLRPVKDENGNQRYFEGNTSRPMKTFADYSTHTFKFFYMERGSGSSVCRINFNFPMLKQNSVSVQKELTANANIELLGNPDFRFQILKADENGNKSNDLFIGENVTYTIYDGATNEVLGTGTTGANGVFTLKAGQRAEFEGIQENAGKYYVRELLNKDYFAQYGEISVDGNVITAPTGDITLGSESETFTGMDSPVKDASGGTSVFTFDNQVTVNKLGSLAVSKVLGNASDADAHDREFRILVTLDGKKLPVGTAYTLNDGTTETRRIVTEEGIIPLKAGQTAAISGILAGTRFEVSETSESAEGYVVSYAHTNAADGEISTSGVSGTIGLNTVVGVVVTNSENAASVSIPATKSLSNGSLSSGEHTYSFALQQISAKDADGNTLEGFADDSQTETVEVTGSDVTQFAFGLKYAAAQFDADTAFPVTVTYEIRELAEGVTDAITDPAVYTAQVTISKDAAGGIRAALTSLKKGETEVSDQTAAFVNTLTGDLTLKKQVEGGENAKEREFTFQVTLQNSSGEPLAGQTVLYTIGETTHTVTTDADGAFTLEGIRHETEVVIRDLPLGTQWIITETNVQSYLVSWTANGTSGSSHVAAGNIPDGGMSVVYTNTSTYILPETGGGGTIPYTVAGLVLICFSMAYLMYYRSKARGRGSYRSP